MRGGIAIQRDLLGNAPLLDRLLQEPLGRSHIAPFTQEKVNSLPLFVYSSIEIDPVPFHFPAFLGLSSGHASPMLMVTALHLLSVSDAGYSYHGLVRGALLL